MRSGYQIKGKKEGLHFRSFTGLVYGFNASHIFEFYSLSTS